MDSDAVKSIVEKSKIFNNKCVSDLTNFPDDEFLKTAIEDFTKTEDIIHSEKPSIKNAVKTFTKGVLDMTFFEESQLVEEEFKAIDSHKIMLKIIETLDDVETTCKHLQSACKMNDLLGEELSECLFWRKGALFYMFCHTKQENQQWKEQNLELYRDFLHRGTEELQKMLKVRANIDWSDTRISTDDTAVLFDEGIFSDTHLLAIMYAGEMCYWYVQESRGEPENVSETARQFLRLYVSAVEGPLKCAAWNCDHAKKYLEDLSSWS